MCPTEGFPRQLRLTQARQYSAVFGDGDRLASPRLLLRVRENAVDNARLGMAISRKRARTAVLRNRIKRLLRERFRRQQAQWPALDLVVMLRGPLQLTDLGELGDEFQHLVERALARIARRSNDDEATD